MNASLNTTTQTIDERCAELANSAFHAAIMGARLPKSNPRRYGARLSACQNAANRIIALRTAEQAARKTVYWTVGGYSRKFSTLAAAVAVADEVFRRTGCVVCVEKVSSSQAVQS